MPIKKIPNSYLNNNAVFTPTRTVGEKVNEVIENLNDLNTTVEELQAEVSSGEFENITVTDTATIENAIFNGTVSINTVGINDATIDEATVINLNVAEQLTLAKGNATQSTSFATTVSLPTPVNYSSGIITTFTANTAAGATSIFNVGSALLYDTSKVVILTIQYGGAGTPVLNYARTLPDTIVIKITNIHTTDALDNTIKIHYLAL
jgi:hypothetical protein